MNGYETWANVNRLARYLEPPRYVSREEWLRQERIAVGKVCRCGDCLCCEEVKKEKQR
jgi:hypothetical protein